LRLELKSEIHFSENAFNSYTTRIFVIIGF